MKIYILPYTFKTYFSETTIISGIDLSIIKINKVLNEMNHETRLFLLSGEVETISNVHIEKPKLEQEMTRKYFIENRKQIYTNLIKDIITYKPDIIFSSYEINTGLYKQLISLNIPIIYHCHETPGSFQFLNTGNLLSEMSKQHTIVCVTNHHKKVFEKYFSRKKELWNFKSLDVDYICPPTYVDQIFEATETDGYVRHISALNPNKKTFGICSYLEETNINHEVFTTIKHLQKSNDIIKNYADKNIKKYLDKIRFDRKHSEIMNSLSKSVCSFVALGTDTYTITSLESLSRGVPLILGTNKEFVHPALEMCDDKMKEKYVRLIQTKNEFLQAVEYFKTLTIDDRKELVELTKQHNSLEKYKVNLQNLLDYTIKKYDKNKQTLLNYFE